MLILAFESSGKAASVALFEDEKKIDENFRCDGHTHSETLLPMCEELLKRNSIEVKDIDLISCAEGPGSFTGIRIGISTVKGLSWASDVKCLGVSTCEAMAYLCRDLGGIICTVQDARRAQVYNALFDVSDGNVVRLCEDRPIAIEDLAKEIIELGREVTLTGDGTDITAPEFDRLGVKYKTAPAELVMPRASGVALASVGKEGYPSQDLLPVYLRLSQAERERQQKNNI